MAKIPTAPPVISKFKAKTRRISTKAIVAIAKKIPRNQRTGIPSAIARTPETKAATSISNNKNGTANKLPLNLNT
ncbi:hypothetical protein H6F70_21810 [Coleofasciculus sp. FACHB-T130]|uniref:hypothetical protein n=1 Tax=Coleofasciculus sp. FACHB-125 TaxID=2692784 RepID=UPI0016835EC4|nr:hypothetical protein [Coleofasciculus sp. FACHB-T130]MBD1899307.1 hypothetical protein [Coleofasciculus sp. FACHB-125]